MSTPDHLERQAEAAMHRINTQINRSAGQHIRAVRRKARADQPPALHVIDTHQLPDARTAEQHGDVSTADQPCPPGFCGFDARCSNHTCPGHPAHAQQRLAQWSDEPDSDNDSHIGGMQMLGYGLIALALTSCATLVAFAIGLPA